MLVKGADQRYMSFHMDGLIFLLIIFNSMPLGGKLFTACDRVTKSHVESVLTFRDLYFHSMMSVHIKQVAIEIIF
jgi:hypothetical protein